MYFKLVFYVSLYHTIFKLKIKFLISEKKKCHTNL